MGDSDEHHWVPAFLLRRFSADEKRIDLFSLKRGRVFRGVSVREQCRRRHLYGKDPAFERVLCDIEGESATALRAIAALRLQGDPEGELRARLSVFVATMFARTPSAFRELNAYIDRFAKERILANSDMTREELDRVRAEVDLPHVLKFRSSPAIAMALFPLAHVLVRTPPAGPRLVLSDDPIVRYNTYLEGTEGLGTTGIATPGIQIFVPLDPRRMVVLYDPTAYGASCVPDEGWIVLKDSDVDQLNLLQHVFADRSVYGETLDPDVMDDLASRAGPLRLDRAVVHADYDDPKGVYTVSSSQTPNVRLNLSFLRVLPSAARVPLADRLRTRQGPGVPPRKTLEAVEKFTKLKERRHPLG